MTKVSMLSSAGALLGLSLISGPTLAQGSDSASDEVVIVAPYVTSERHTVIGATGDRGVFDVHSLTKEVSYSDLNLANPADADRFVQRIRDTAKRSCEELKEKFPDPPNAPVTMDDECVRNATAQAMLIATSLIEHAKLAMAAPPPAPVAEAAPPAPVYEAPPAPVAEAAPPPEPAPAMEAEATVPPKQDRN